MRLTVSTFFGKIQGVNIRRIQQYLGHHSLSSTMVYLHLTTQGHERAYGIINDLMQEV